LVDWKKKEFDPMNEEERMESREAMEFLLLSLEAFRGIPLPYFPILTAALDFI
jgi:hypothetical protein